MTTPRVIAVIPAAGVGSRMQADRPKQYLTIANKTILEHTIDALIEHPLIDDVIVAISKDDAYFDALGLRAKPITVVNGGKERADSVLSGIMALNDDDWALVHDAARPCVDSDDITNLMKVMHDSSASGGILATPVRDTMKRAHDQNNAQNHAKNIDNSSSAYSVVSHTEDRENLWHALTPQLFPAALLKAALKQGIEQGLPITDEASAMEFAGHCVAMINGSPANIKVTHPADLPLAEFYLQQRLATAKKNTDNLENAQTKKAHT